MHKNTFLNKRTIANGWSDFLTQSNIESINEITKNVLADINNDTELLCPSPEKVFRFFETPLQNIKVIILGQDPYPQKGIATGRAFEVNGLKSWNSPFRNPSLQNIVRSIIKAKTGEILRFNEIRALLNNDISIHPPDKIFSSWEKQGVLLLNKSLTCTLNKPNSHLEYWDSFTKELLNFINNRIPTAYWFIWGNYALNAIEHIKPSNTIFSYHPSRCQNRENDFLYGDINCFYETKDIVDWSGYIKHPSLF